MKPTEDVQGVSHKSIGLLSARKIMVVKPVPRAALAVNAGTAENDGPRNAMFVVDLNKNADGNFSAKTTLR